MSFGNSYNGGRTGMVSLRSFVNFEPEMKEETENEGHNSQVVSNNCVIFIFWRIVIRMLNFSLPI